MPSAGKGQLERVQAEYKGNISMVQFHESRQNIRLPKSKNRILGRPEGDLFAFEFLASGKLDALISTVVDTDAFVLTIWSQYMLSRSSSSVIRSMACRVCGMVRVSTVPSPISAPRIAPHIS